MTKRGRQAPKRSGLPKPLQGRGCQIGYSGLWGGVGVFRVVKGGKVYIIRRWGAYYKEIRYIL